MGSNLEIELEEAKLQILLLEREVEALKQELFNLQRKTS